MALSLLYTAVTGQTITAANWNAEFNNIYNNFLSGLSPLTGNIDFNNFRALNFNVGSVTAPSWYFNSDADTGIYSSAANTFDITTGGTQAASLGASFTLRAAPEDSRTNTVDVAGIIESTTSGVPAASIGVGLQFNAESADENPSAFGRLDFTASDITAGSEDTYHEIWLRVAGAALVSCYRFAATGAFNAIFTHANTAARTYTLQDSSDTIVGRATTDTLTNKTLSGSVVTGAAPSPPTANVLYVESLLGGFVETSGAGAWTIDRSFNVSSITDNGVGDFTVNWGTALASANYAVSCCAQGSGSLFGSVDTTTAKSATVCRFQLFDDTGAVADPSNGVNVIATIG